MQGLRIGIAGFGVVGRRRKACIDRHRTAEVAAVCDRMFEADGWLDDKVRCFRSYHQLFDQGIDALIVCLTNDIAAEVTIAGLEAGMHIFCEKPPGKSIDDIHRVIGCEQQHPSLKLMYGFNHRYHDSVQDALQILQGGELGRVINIRGVYGKAKMVTLDQSSWRTKREIAGGGILLDQGIHMLDLMRLFGGEFEKVYSVVANNHWGFDVEDNAYALMRTDDGVIAMVHSSATQWRHRFSLEITLQRGSLILGGILSGTKSYGAETLTVIRADPDHDRGDPREVTTRYNNDSSWDQEIAEFVSSIENDALISSGTSRDALQTMRLVYRIYYADPVWRQRYSIPNPDA